MSEITPELLRRERTSLEAEIAGLEPKRKRLGLIVELLRTFGDDAEQPALLEVPVKLNGNTYAGKGITESILMLLKDCPHDFFTPREMRDIFRKGGIQAKTPNLSTIIYTASKRMVSQGALEQSVKSGTKAFRLKNPAAG